LDSSILIVDDDPGLVEVIGQILADVGQLRFATNGKDALRVARESPPRPDPAGRRNAWHERL
jgi:CheY-like chemotaxis protein